MRITSSIAPHSWIMDVMQRFVAAYPAARLSCLPHMDGEYRETELGVRGDADQVGEAWEWLCDALRSAGFTWRDGGR